MKTNSTLKHKFVSKLSDSETKRNDVLAEIEDFLKRKEKYLEEDLVLSKFTRRQRILVKRFLKRLEKDKCHSNSGLVYSDFLMVIARINEHLCNVTQGILNVGKRQR